MKRYFGFLLLILLFSTSCNVVGEAGSCGESDTDYQVLEDPETGPDKRGWGNYTGQCEDEEEN